MELFVPSGTICPIRIPPLISSAVGALEVEEGHGNICAQQEYIQVCLQDSGVSEV